MFNNFWEDFQVAKNAKVGPFVLRNRPELSKIISFDSAIDLFRKVLSLNDVSVNVDGNYAAKPSLPNYEITKTNFKSYISDSVSLNQGSVITFTKDYCLEYSSEIAKGVSEFMSGYISSFGVPSNGTNAVFITGKYKETWIGLHNDYCDTFLIPVVGSKRFLFWEPHYFDEKVDMSHPNAMNGYCIGKYDVSEIQKDAIEISLSEGDILYIPHGWWHYNLLERPEVTVTLSLGVFNKPESAFSSSVYMNMDKSDRKVRVFPPPSGIITKDYIADLGNLYKSNEVLISNSEIIDILLKSSSNSLILGSGSSCMADSPSSKVLSYNKDYPLYMLKLSGSSCLLFSRGEAQMFKFSFDLEELFRKIVLGRDIDKKSFFDQDCASECCDLINWLVGVGAFK